MTSKTIYLDYQSTTPCDPAVVEKMLPFFSAHYGNAHSPHRMGREAAAAMVEARAYVASLVGAAPQEIVFTAGATESNNIAIKGVARHALRLGSGPRRIITCVTEHKCVLDSVKSLEADGFEPYFLPVGNDGLIDPTSLRDALKVPTLLVSVMGVNNEIGVIQDLMSLSAITRDAGALFHTDAAQAAGKIPLDMADHGFDLVSVSGHKLYGPKGIGALCIGRNIATRLDPLLSGGGQEDGIRPGTAPVPLIVGLGEACRLATLAIKPEGERLIALRNDLLEQLQDRLPDITVNGSFTNRIPGNLNLVFPKDAIALMEACPDLCVSAGSACTSGMTDPSHVLLALGMDRETARRCLRIGLGRFTTADDIDEAADMLVDGVKRRRVKETG